MILLLQGDLKTHNIFFCVLPESPAVNIGIKYKGPFIFFRNTIKNIPAGVYFFSLDNCRFEKLYFRRFVGSQTPMFTIFKKFAEYGSSLFLRAAVNYPD